jgi:F0F1-type ATP synthase assembly protein I
MLEIGGAVGCLTLCIVLASVFGGIALDRLLGTKPLFILLLVLGSAPLSLVLTYFLVMRTTKNMNMPKSQGQQIPPGKEDEIGE